MTEQGFRSAGEHGGEASSMPGDGRMPDRIDTAMKSMQPTGGYGPSNRTLRIAERPL